jgi:hypothetical protein
MQLVSFFQIEFQLACSSGVLLASSCADESFVLVALHLVLPVLELALPDLEHMNTW